MKLHGQNNTIHTQKIELYIRIYNIARNGMPSSCAVLSDSVMSDSATSWTEPARLLCLWGFSRQETWSGLQCPTPGDLPNPGIKPRSPALQVDYSPSEQPGKPKNPGVDSLFFLQGISLNQESKRGLLYCRRILYQLSSQESLPSSYLHSWVSDALFST